MLGKNTGLPWVRVADVLPSISSDASPDRVGVDLGVSGAGLAVASPSKSRGPSSIGVAAGGDAGGVAESDPLNAGLVNCWPSGRNDFGIDGVWP